MIDTLTDDNMKDALEIYFAYHKPRNIKDFVYKVKKLLEFVEKEIITPTECAAIIYNRFLDIRPINIKHESTLDQIFEV